MTTGRINQVAQQSRSNSLLSLARLSGQLSETRPNPRVSDQKVEHARNRARPQKSDLRFQQRNSKYRVKFRGSRGSWHAPKSPHGTDLGKPVRVFHKLHRITLPSSKRKHCSTTRRRIGADSCVGARHRCGDTSTVFWSGNHKAPRRYTTVVDAAAHRSHAASGTLKRRGHCKAEALRL